jgi:hypothetical protein
VYAESKQINAVFLIIKWLADLEGVDFESKPWLCVAAANLARAKLHDGVDMPSYLVFEWR